MTISEIGYAIRDALRDNVIDPLGRQGNLWIHYQRVPSNPEQIGKTPLIFIEPTPFRAGFEYIGTAKQARRIRFNLTICARIGDRGMIDGYPVQSTEDLIGRIADKVYEYIATNSPIITTIKQQGASKTINCNAGIEILDGVGGMFDLTPNVTASRIAIEVMENF